MFEVLAIENKTNGGSNETDAKELIVTPTSSPASLISVMTATPVP
jgi:hypothetical protein